ncbi:MAG: hypothetical protein AAFR17_04305 [Pseudomonadota bacterium]
MDEGFLKLRGRVVDRIGEDLPPSQPPTRELRFQDSPFQMGSAAAIVTILARILLGADNPVTLLGVLALGLGMVFLGRFGLIFSFVGLLQYFWFSAWFALGAGCIIAPALLAANFFGT